MDSRTKQIGVIMYQLLGTRNSEGGEHISIQAILMDEYTEQEEWAYLDFPAHAVSAGGNVSGKVFKEIASKAVYHWLSHKGKLSLKETQAEIDSIHKSQISAGLSGDSYFIVILAGEGEVGPGYDGDSIGVSLEDAGLTDPSKSCACESHIMYDYDAADAIDAGPTSPDPAWDYEKLRGGEY
jgi:hypothetical protein